MKTTLGRGKSKEASRWAERGFQLQIVAAYSWGSTFFTSPESLRIAGVTIIRWKILTLPWNAKPSSHRGNFCDIQIQKQSSKVKTERKGACKNAWRGAKEVFSQRRGAEWGRFLVYMDDDSSSVKR